MVSVAEGLGRSRLSKPGQAWVLPRRIWTFWISDKMKTPMKTTKSLFGILSITMALVGMLAGTAHCQIFVSLAGSETIGEYTTAGTTVNASLVSGLNSPYGIAIEIVPEPSSFELAALGLCVLFAIFQKGVKTEKRQRVNPEQPEIN